MSNEEKFKCECGNIWFTIVAQFNKDATYRLPTSPFYTIGCLKCGKVYTPQWYRKPGDEFETFELTENLHK